MTRIKILTPEYAYHSNDVGRTAFLSNSEIKSMMKLLSKETFIELDKRQGIECHSIWEAMLKYLSMNNNQGIDYSNLPMPDYTQLEVDKKKASKHNPVYKTGLFF